MSRALRARLDRIERMLPARVCPVCFGSPRLHIEPIDARETDVVPEPPPPCPGCGRLPVQVVYVPMLSLTR